MKIWVLGRGQKSENVSDLTTSIIIVLLCHL